MWVPGVPVAMPVVVVAFCWVVLNVAAVAAPFPSTVTVTGLVRPKFWQLRLVKDMFSRLAMNVSRLFPTASTGDVPVASSAWLLARNAVWMLTMFWQNMAGLLVTSLVGETSGWPTSARYRSVFCTLKLLL